MADISGITGAWTRYEDTVNQRETGDTLGKDDFLKLLVAQLTHQDPTNPMQDTEFVSQLATYSGLEQQMTMNKNLETLIGLNAANTAASVVSLISYAVGYTDTETGELKVGIVDLIDIVGGEVYLSINDGSAQGDYIPFTQVEHVAYPLNTEKPKEDGEDGSKDDDQTGEAENS